MSRAEIELRRLLPPDAEIYREIRLQALQLAPEAFGSTFETESAEPLSWFATRLADAAVFGAFAGGALLGVAGVFVKQGRKEAHKGVLWGMYVRPAARGAGLGRRLVEAVVDHACRQLEVVLLTTVSSNEQARRLYTSLGFIEYGIEKNSLKHNGRYWDEILMAKPLLPDAASRS